MGSSRFPGKPLARLAGRPMIEHVYKRTRMSPMLDEVFVATCDREIQEAVERFGGRAIMTSSAHQRASDRVAEVARSIECDIVVMVQGDEPMIVPAMIDAALEPLRRDPMVVCSNVVAPIRSLTDFEDPNTIKVVIAPNGNALYFSREPIPALRGLPFESINAYKQVCVIPFRRDFLLRYAALEPTPLEQAESIDMLRALEHGYPVRLVKTGFLTQSVDTTADLQRVEALLREDPLVPRYGKPS
jgi:3-deoxy-manno-octulosonate cytidylyltransferase (CMP-KDO synthetase)